MVNKSIQEIKEISRINAEINSKMSHKFLKKKTKREGKEVKKCITDINKQILKTANDGKYKLAYDPRIFFTNRQRDTIRDYFLHEGYSINIEEFDPLTPLVTISWEEDDG